MFTLERLVTADAWEYFDLPPDEEQRLRGLFTTMVGPLRLPDLVDTILHDASHDTPFSPSPIYGIGDSVQIAAAMLYIIADFIGQYHKLGRRYKVPLLPVEIMKFFKYPWNQFRDMNMAAQKRVARDMTKKYKRGSILNAT